MRLVTLIGMLAISMTAGAFDLGELKARVGELEQQASDANAPASGPAGLAQFSSQEQIGSLRQALTQGAETAVRDLARENGYLGNDRVRIPLPENLQNADRAMRRLGLGKYSDDLQISMNRAAEAAVPEAKALLVDAVKHMTVSDAKGILLGKDDAATQYFRRNTEAALGERFKPVVVHSMQQVSLAQTYNRFAGSAERLGLIGADDANIEDYVTRKALDGLFLMMADQEKEIRARPLQATGDLARKVFAALRAQ